MRNISIIVDFTSGLNLYPDLRLCNNSVQYAQSIARMQSVLHKMSVPVNASTHTIGQTFSADAVRNPLIYSVLSVDWRWHRSESVGAGDLGAQGAGERESVLQF